MARSRQQHRSRTLSQNFLVDRATAARFVRAARPDPAGLLLEVGPGKGALTTALAPYCRELRAYEIDPGLLPGLRATLHAAPHVRVYERDFVGVPPPREPFAVVGNVPFSRTADIVDWCLRAPALTDATLITQLEYARRRTGDFGRWSLRTVLTWPQVEWRLVGRIGRREFRPVPRVDAGILRIERRPRRCCRPPNSPTTGGWWRSASPGPADRCTRRCAGPGIRAGGWTGRSAWRASTAPRSSRSCRHGRG